MIIGKKEIQHKKINRKYRNLFSTLFSRKLIVQFDVVYLAISYSLVSFIMLDNNKKYNKKIECLKNIYRHIIDNKPPIFI